MPKGPTHLMGQFYGTVGLLSWCPNTLYFPLRFGNPELGHKCPKRSSTELRRRTVGFYGANKSSIIYEATATLGLITQSTPVNHSSCGGNSAGESNPVLPVSKHLCRLGRFGTGPRFQVNTVWLGITFGSNSDRRTALSKIGRTVGYL